MYNELTVVPRKKTASNPGSQPPPAPAGKSRAAKIRAVARGENTASSAKSEQEVLFLKRYLEFGLRTYEHVATIALLAAIEPFNLRHRDHRATKFKLWVIDW